MLKDLYIIGAGGFGGEVAWMIERINSAKKEWKLKGFIDEDISAIGKEKSGYKIMGNLQYLADIETESWVLCAIANANVKKRIISEVKKNRHLNFATIIDPGATLSKDATVGEGTIICAGTIITTEVCIGNHVIINLGCTLGHNSCIHDYATVHPGCSISGNVVIDDGVEIGTGTQIIPGKFLGSFSVLGAGSTVIDDIPKNCVAVGSPAIPVRFMRQAQPSEVK